MRLYFSTRIESIRNSDAPQYDDPQQEYFTDVLRKLSELTILRQYGLTTWKGRPIDEIVE